MYRKTKFCSTKDIKVLGGVFCLPPFIFQAKRCENYENDKKSCGLLSFYINIRYICKEFEISELGKRKTFNNINGKETTSW